MPWEMPAPRDVPTAKAAPPTCANCKMTIDRDPYEKGSHTFCCDGCAYGGPCVC